MVIKTLVYFYILMSIQIIATGKVTEKKLYFAYMIKEASQAKE